MLYQNTQNYYQITRVNDSVGKSAQLQYNANGTLWKITDSVDLVSQFTYGAGNLITALTTPYGVTTFASGGASPNRWLEVTDPMGGKERYEYREWCQWVPDTAAAAPAGFSNAGLENRNSFYWSRKAMEEMTNGGVVTLDYAKAQITHWMKSADDAKTVAVPHSTKEPLEGRVWYQYSGQPGPNQVGAQGQAIKVARVLDGGATQASLYTYNSLGRVTEQTDPVGRKFAFDYATDGIDLLAVRQIRNGANVTVMSFPAAIGDPAYEKHQPRRMKNAAGRETRMTYNTRAQIELITNPKGEQTKYVYYADAPGQPRHGRLQSVTAAFGSALAATTTLNYDAFGRLGSTLAPDGYLVNVGYDAIGGVAAKTLDRPSRTTYPDGTYEEVGWTSLSPTSLRDRRGRVTLQEFDLVGRLAETTDPLGRVTTYEWCSCGALSELHDPAGHITSWTRDTRGRVTAKLIEGLTAATYEYDNAGRLLRVADALGQKTESGYYADNRLSSTTYPNPLKPTPNVTYTYDPDYPRPLTTTTVGLPALTYSYVPFNPGDSVYGDGQMASVSGYFGDVMTYSYDELDRHLTRTLQGTSTQSYDALGRVSGWSNPLGSFVPAYIVATGGVPTPRLDSVTYPNGMQVDLDWYDNLGDRRLKELHNKASGSAMMSKFNYLYDAGGQITRWTLANGSSATTRWEMAAPLSDLADQLKGVDQRNDATGALLKTYRYGYDLAGNRTSEQIDTATTTWSVNARNQLVTQTNPARSFTYNANGAMTNNGAGQTYNWDAAGRLWKITYTSTGASTEFGYDGLGRRVKIIERNSAGAVTNEKRFVWEGMQLVQRRNSANALTLRYYPEGHLEDNGSYGVAGFTPAKVFYTRDHLGSIREVTSPSATSDTRYRYDPYGRQTTGVTGTYAAEFGYTGHYQHGPSGLTLAPFRAYEAGLGRWLSRDPIGEGGD